MNTVLQKFLYVLHTPEGDVLLQESCNKLDLSESEDFWLEDGVTIKPHEVVVSKRIGIESAGEEWANKPLRFYILDNPFVSIRDKVSEELLKHPDNAS